MKGIVRGSIGKVLNRFGFRSKQAGGLLKAGGCISMIILLLTGCSLIPQYVSVAFETNSDDAIASAEGLREGDLIPEPAVPEKSGYVFVGWFTDEGLTDMWDFSSDAVLSETYPGKLYAKWTPESSTLSFNANGGSGSMTSITLDTDETRDLPENLFTLTGYTFDGWAKSSTGDAVYSDEGNLTMEPADTELYAVWKPETYPITYLLYGGTNAVANPASYTIEDAAITLEPPRKDGHRFLGWYSDSGYTTASAEIPEGSMGSKTFYALWRWGELTAGDTGPAGGLIFYDDEADGIDDLPGFRYLEAAPDGWYNGGNDPELLWGGIPAGGTETGLGAGMSNTALIISGSASTGGDDTAAARCYNYSITTDGVVYNDWFLPSLDELELLYIFFQCEQPEYSRSFIPTTYISSSEIDHEKLWAVNFRGPGPGSSDVKVPIILSKKGAVRPVRAF